VSSESLESFIEDGVEILEVFVLYHRHLLVDLVPRWVENCADVVATFLHLLFDADLVLSHYVFQLLKVLSLSVKHDLISIEHDEHGAYICLGHVLGSLARV